ncbi:MAG: MFS transporter [Alphaproteobacteria bacterium]|nr:MFS transporter [Alphaproteobacteria bacterium]
MAVSLVGEGAAYVAAVQAGSILVLSLWCGAIVDRWDPRHAMVAADAGRVAAPLVLVVVILAGMLQPWHLYAMAILLSLFSSIYDPALQIAVTRASPSTDALQSLNALVDGARRLARIVAPGLVAIVAASIPVYHLLTMSAATSAASALAILAAWAALSPGSDDVARPSGRNWLGDIGVAIAAARAHTLMAYAIFGIAVRTACWVTVFYLCLPLRMQQESTGDIAAFGVVVAVFGAGNLVGSALAGAIRHWRPGLVTAAGRAIMGIGFIAVAWAGDFYLVLAGAALSAVGGPLGDLPSLGLLRSEFAADVIGKIVSLRTLADGAGMLVGMLAAPSLIAWVGLSSTIGLWSLALTAVGLFGLWLFRSEFRN